MLDPEEHKRKTARNRAFAPGRLMYYGIEFQSRNNGAHLIVTHNGWTVDFWPGTGKFTERRGRWSGRGVLNLIKRIQR